MSEIPPGRWRYWRWWLLAIFLAAALQVWGLVRGALGVRAVVYNDGPAALENASLVCAGEAVPIGALEVQDSRYSWFRPAERTAVLGLTWAAAGEHHEDAWAVERGERLTLRVRSDGEVTVSRERALGRRLLDALDSE